MRQTEIELAFEAAADLSVDLMRVIRSLVAVGLIVVSIISGSASFGQTATLRYDGAYHHTDAGKTTQHLRFYRDGSVISAATPRSQTPGWLERGFPGLASGRYSVRGDSIQITLNTNLPGELSDADRGSIPRTLHYTGVIGPAYLELRRDGRAEPKRYGFVKVASWK